MSSLLNHLPTWLLLAQDGGDPAAPSFPMWPMFVMIGLLFYFMMIRPERQKKADMAKMLEDLKQNDRVVTIGGLYGVVANAKKDEEFVAIRIDDENNTRLKVLKSAISRVITDETKGKDAS